MDNTDWSFAPLEQPKPPQQTWLRFWVRLAVIVFFGLCFGMLLKQHAHAGEVRQAVINDPASARSPDVRPLISDDLRTYLAGGHSAIGWSMHLVTAAELEREFRTNEVAAARKYSPNGSDVVIRGTVSRVAVALGTPVIYLGQFGPLAYMKDGDTFAETLKPGDKVVVACRRVRMVAMVGAFDCESRDAYVKRMVEGYFYSMHGLAKQGDKTAARLLAIASR